MGTFPIYDAVFRNTDAILNGDFTNAYEFNQLDVENMNLTDVGEIGNSMQMYDRQIPLEVAPGSMGTTSMFNEYNTIVIGRIAKVDSPSGYNHKLMYDIPLFERTDASTVNLNYTIPDNHQKYKAPTAGRIIEEANKGTKYGFGQMPYSWSDFLYCKYYGLIPNNQLITLRRYPLAVTDNAETPDEKSPLLPVAQAVTWLGDDPGNKLSSLFKFSFGVNWKEIEATVQEVEGNEVGFGAGMEALLGPAATTAIATAGSFMGILPFDEGRWSGRKIAETEWMQNAWSSTGPYWNQIYGPVNVVNKNHMRERGLFFNHEITLKFQYSLKSINGVNPKIAMLDLITNFLSLTYTNAKFWGGMMRYFPNYKDPILFFGDQGKFYSGDYEGYIADVLASLKTNIAKTGDDAAKWANQFTSASGISEKAEVVKSAAGTFIEKMGKMMLGSMARRSRPKMLSIRSLLQGNPIGEWHLTLGNPMNPIATIGNLIVTNTELEFGDILGFDDFPTEVTFTVTLKHARPRDKGDVESMLNLGQGRLSYSPLTKLPSESNTNGENYTKEDFIFSDKPTYAGPEENKETSVAKGEAYSERLNDAKFDYGASEAQAKNIRRRIHREWGSSFAWSKQFETMINKKQHVT